jgi:HSP20 family protein
MIKKKEKNIKIKTTKDKKPATEKTTTPTVWNPFDMFENMDRYFWDDPWTPSFWRSWWPTTRFNRTPERDWKTTPLDLVDTGSEYKVIAEMPGIQKKNLEVNVTPNTISICGETSTETEEEETGYIRHERSYSTICRNMAFPEEVNPDKAEATLKDGILEVRVAKKTPTAQKGKSIPIK